MSDTIEKELRAYYDSRETLLAGAQVGSLKNRLEVVRRSLAKNPLPKDSPPMLLVNNGKHSQWYPLRQSVTIGASDINALQLDDPCVSRRHCCLEEISSGWNLSDLNSANGVYVNGKRMTTAKLKDGDIIQIADVVMIFINT